MTPHKESKMLYSIEGREVAAPGDPAVLMTERGDTGVMLEGEWQEEEG